MLQNQLIYQVFVRNYSEAGNFDSLRLDLPRIKALGTDILYLMPIHPIGVEARKGTYGSPYAILDYFGITEDYGTLNDFHRLVEDTHKLGMKIILDMVFHHTSPDNPLTKTHPEYYFYKNGKRGNRIGDWTDIVDLDTDREDVHEFLLSILEYWVKQGVDGFRFDVASLISLSFFKKAREELGKDIIFFAESVDYPFAKYLSTTDHPSIPDPDMVPTFDILYNYSYFRNFEAYLKGENELPIIIKLINMDYEYRSIIKRAHCLENHDVPRIARLIPDQEKLISIINLFYSLDGYMFLYMGQEYGIAEDVPLFEKKPVDWSKKNETITAAYESAIKAFKKEKPAKKQVLSLINEHTICIQKYLEDGSILEEEAVIK